MNQVERMDISIPLKKINIIILKNRNKVSILQNMFFVQLCVEILVHVKRIGGEEKDTHGHDRT